MVVYQDQENCYCCLPFARTALYTRWGASPRKNWEPSQLDNLIEHPVYYSVFTAPGLASWAWRPGAWLSQQAEHHWGLSSFSLLPGPRPIVAA